jgi:hypothetical protein
MDINNEKDLKQMIQLLIKKIEVNEDGSLKIDYNLALPSSARV